MTTSVSYAVDAPSDATPEFKASFATRVCGTYLELGIRMDSKSQLI